MCHINQMLPTDPSLLPFQYMLITVRLPNHNLLFIPGSINCIQNKWSVMVRSIQSRELWDCDRTYQRTCTHTYTHKIQFANPQEKLGRQKTVRIKSWALELWGPEVHISLSVHPSLIKWQLCNWLKSVYIGYDHKYYIFYYIHNVHPKSLNYMCYVLNA